MARRLDTAGHRNRWDCACQSCNLTRTECGGCNSPHDCYVKARSMLNALQGKWNPLAAQPEDYEADDARELQAGLGEKESRFDPKITSSGGLTGSFRIFCD
ncbi:hypothetical protein C8R43DRAFT_858362, partial [Mycena crocata]